MMFDITMSKRNDLKVQPRNSGQQIDARARKLIDQLHSPPSGNHWRDKLRDEYWLLIIQCYEEEIYPLPTVLINLTKLLLKKPARQLTHSIDYGISEYLNDNPSSIEIQICIEAHRLVIAFLENLQAKPKLREDYWSLILTCHQNNSYPLPEDLIELTRLLLGKNKGKIQSTKKFCIQSLLAEKYDPPNNGEEIKADLIKFSCEHLEKLKGLRTPIPIQMLADGKHDYTQTVRPWFKEPSFLHGWKIKRENHKRFVANLPPAKVLADVEEILGQL